VQSVASINPPDLPSMPAPDRKDKGSDSFSLMLDTAAQQPDNSAPEAGPPSDDGSSPPPRKMESRPANDPEAPPQDDSGKASAFCERSGDDASKTGGSTVEEKNSGKSSKKSSKDDGATDAVQAIATPVPDQSVPQIGTLPAGLVALDAPKTDGGGSAPAGGDPTKPAAVEIAATAGAGTPALVSPGAPGASGTPGALAAPGTAIAPEAPVASQALAAPEGAPKSSVETPPLAIAGAAQAVAMIEATAKDASISLPSDTQAAADNAPKGVVNIVPAAQALADAAKSTVVIDGNASNPKPLAADRALSGDAPIQSAPVNAEADQPSRSSETAAFVRLAAKVAPNSRAPETVAADRALETAAIRPVSLTAELSQPATLPQSLDAFASSLKSASAELQAPGAPTSGQGVPLTSAAIAVEIAARVKEGSRQFDIRLDPPELGRIDVRLDVDKSGGVSTRLTVDRPETLQLLQNDARGLERALQSAGLKTEDGSLQFSLRQQSPDGSAGQQAQSGTDPRPGTIYVDEVESAAAGLEQYQWAARLRGGVDIRV
jgi:flagellar hook-length control protein FliK